MLAYLSIAAGLLMGSGGAVFPAMAVALIAATAAIWRRSMEWASLAGLLAVGALAGRSISAADARCAAAIEAGGAATILLREEAKPGASARGFALGSGCRVTVRMRVAEGNAPAGATVHAGAPGAREAAESTR